MYQYKYGGKKGKTFDLVEAQDLVVVRTKEPTGNNNGAEDLSKTSRDLMSRMIPIVKFPEANVTVFKCINKGSRSSTGLRNTIRRHLKEEESVKFAGRVLKDRKSGEPVIYTENFFLKFKDSVTKKECKSIIKECNLRIKEQLRFAKNAFFVAAEKGTGMEVFDISMDLLKKSKVEYCHPELVRKKKHRSIHPNQWHLKPATINGHFIDQHVHVEAAWQYNRGEGTIIAVIDDGVDVTHEEFSTPGKIVAPRDTVINVDDGSPKRPEENHGTPCAGVACASGRFKASGVAPEARLMPIRSGGLGSLAEAKAFQWATDNGADVISCSWGPADGPWWDSQDPLHFIPFDLPDSTRLAIDYAVKQGRGGKGCVIVWAAGNGNEIVDIDGYASHHQVIAVAASNDRGKRSYYSDYGNAVWCCFPSNDVYASFIPHPKSLTSGIWTTDRMGRAGDNYGEATLGGSEGHYYSEFGGTSSSCPGVAGVIALMLSENENLGWKEVKEIIKNSCDQIDIQDGDYDAKGHSPYYGYGKINAAVAVENALKAKEEETIAYTIKGVAQYSKDKEVAIDQGQIATDLKEGSRFCGFNVELVPYAPNLSLRYKTIINKKGATKWTPAGTYNGTKDRRRKIIGFAMELTGDLASKYSIHYEATLKGRKKLATGAGGSICGTNKDGGAAVEKIKVWIEEK